MSKQCINLAQKFNLKINAVNDLRVQRLKKTLMFYINKDMIKNSE